jgi:hypothetical protein
MQKEKPNTKPFMLSTILSLGSMFGGGVDERLIDRGYLYCIPCGDKRTVEENGEVEACVNEECKGSAYNLYEERGEF